MKLVVFNTSMIRTPAFSLEADIIEVWDDLKNKISLASPEFYSLIKDMSYLEWMSSPAKIRFTTWKYFNRSKFRAVPFGEFSGFSILKCGNNKGDSIVLERSLSKHRFIDWGQKDIIGNRKLAPLGAYLRSNSTIYKVGIEIRFVSFRSEKFNVSCVTSFPELSAILNHCSQGIFEQTLRDLVCQSFNMRVADFDNLLADIIKHQLLWTDQLPNITGPDFFKRIDSDGINDPVYVISERKPLDGSVNTGPLKHLPEFIEFLSTNISKPTNVNMKTFVSKFVERFGQKEVPLTEVMDIEIGIGYASLEQFEQEREIIDLLRITGGKGRVDKDLFYTSFHAFIINNLMNRADIHLEEFKKDDDKEIYSLPNSFSAIYRMYNGNPVISSLGGATAASLLGRFSLASSEIEESIKEIIQIEENSNPNIIFFDIAYQAEKQVDNVNRRKNLYSFELPILTWSCLDTPLNVDDILISVRDSEVILMSKHLGKRMIPRVASAYNYTRSDLSIYRFLCDLQHQGLNTNFTFDLQDFLPDLSHYPRVYFKNIIVSPAKWLLPKELLEIAKTNHIDFAKEALRNWLSSNGIDFSFKMGHADMTLCFDPANDDDLLFVVLFIKQQKQTLTYISESLVSANSDVKDQFGSNYLAEYLVSYYHEQKIYKSLSKQQSDYRNDTVKLPGGDWLYFEIYCSVLRSNEILLECIKTYLKINALHIRKWFFIRYNNPEPHIRLRVHLSSLNAIGILIKEMHSLLASKVSSGIVTKIEIKTYFRETERYGTNSMVLVEKYFYYDSIYTIKLISKFTKWKELYCISLLFLEDILNTCFSSIEAQILFSQMMAGSFSSEFKAKHTDYKKINSEFKGIFKNIANFTSLRLSKQTIVQKHTLEKIINTCKNETREKMIADLIHMHVNRLFSSNQRIHELLIYQYLVKMFMIKRAKSSTVIL